MCVEVDKREKCEEMEKFISTDFSTVGRNLIDENRDDHGTECIIKFIINTSETITGSRKLTCEI